MAQRTKKRRAGSPSLAELGELQAAAIGVARGWHAGELTFLDVDVGECLEYPTMENVVTALRQELEGEDVEGSVVP